MLLLFKTDVETTWIWVFNQKLQVGLTSQIVKVLEKLLITKIIKSYIVMSYTEV